MKKLMLIFLLATASFLGAQTRPDYVTTHAYTTDLVSVNSLAEGASTSLLLLDSAFESGDLLISDSTNTYHGKFYFYEGTTVEEQDSDMAFSPTYNASGTINVYISGGEIRAQNNASGAVGLRATIRRQTM